MIKYHSRSVIIMLCCDFISYNAALWPFEPGSVSSKVNTKLLRLDQDTKTHEPGYNYNNLPFTIIFFLSPNFLYVLITCIWGFANRSNETEGLHRVIISQPDNLQCLYFPKALKMSEKSNRFCYEHSMSRINLNLSLVYILTTGDKRLTFLSNLS